MCVFFFESMVLYICWWAEVCQLNTPYKQIWSIDLMLQEIYFDGKFYMQTQAFIWCWLMIHTTQIKTDVELCKNCIASRSNVRLFSIIHIACHGISLEFSAINDNINLENRFAKYFAAGWLYHIYDEYNSRLIGICKCIWNVMSFIDFTLIHNNIHKQ